MKATFYGKGGSSDKKSYDVEVTTLQAAALSAFVDGTSYTFEELGTKLNLEAQYLKPVMHSLCCGKYKVSRGRRPPPPLRVRQHLISPSPPLRS